ncbi:type II secretion system protein GspM [Desulfonema magnum]|uniref:Type II secretion system protein M domain-containing protein n=1 Tax=Desulfonema magnum TaxID=45655 RepID=A0A975BX99_9BACT|nr:type II secretion system protein GspM [Desulfonema magnum]QTA93227.1 Type II secretion system protein M domain-containing protein [Desulfonema magnum]
MKLNKREKYTVFAGGAFVCLFILLQFIVFPFMEKKERLERNLLSKTKTLEEMRALQSEYNVLTKQAELSKIRFARKKKGFTLFSFLDRLAGEAGIKDNIAYMKPSKSDKKDSPFKLSLVEMKLQGINLKQLTPYLHKIETSENSVFIRKISITKKGKEKGFINAVLQVETFEI